MADPAPTARDFPHNTCPASRHAELIADQLESGRLASILDDPRHAGGSIRATVEALWEARTALNRIGAALIGEAAETVPWWAETGRVAEAAEGASAPSADLASLIEMAMATYATSEDSEEKAEEHQDAYDKLVCFIASFQSQASKRARSHISTALRSAFDRYKASMNDGVDVSERVEASSNFNVVAFNMIAKLIEGEAND